MDKKVITNNNLETQELGQEFARKLKSGDIVLLYGDLGSGKTTFVQGLAKGLNITERILSPTFVLHRVHQVPNSDIKTFNHVDLYRIKKPTEIKNLGLGEVIGENNSIVVIEWADRLRDFNVSKGYRIYFKHLDGDKREIRIERI